MIIVIGRFKLKARQGRVGLSHLRDHVAFAARFKGCLEVHLARSLEDPDQYLVCSRWDAPESYSAMTLQLRRPSQAQKGLLELMQLLERDPTFERFETL